MLWCISHAERADIMASTITAKSQIEGIRWPAIASPVSSALLAILFQLERSQWWDPGQLSHWQFAQLAVLLEHAYQTVPFYRQQFDAIGFSPTSTIAPEDWSRLPIVQRAALESAGAQAVTTALPAAHGRMTEKRTSGSTGEPGRFVSTQVSSQFWHALTLRDHLWHGRELSAALAVVRSGRSVRDPFAITRHNSWGPPADLVFDTGPGVLLYHSLPIERQAALLREFNPHYLLTYPSNLLALARCVSEHGESLTNLREVRTYGEPVEDAVREACRSSWGAALTDTYSAEEAGYLALQCPLHCHYHVQSESVLLEVIDAAGNACRPGETGRVVITTLHNFAMPLIRYAIGDYAVVGQPCDCGRGLPVLQKIVGRERNLLHLADGTLRVPDMSALQRSAIGEIDRLQVVQIAPSRVRVRVAGEQPLAGADRETLERLVLQVLGGEFELEFSFEREVERHANGKFEPFVSLLD